MADTFIRSLNVIGGNRRTDASNNLRRIASAFDNRSTAETVMGANNVSMSSGRVDEFSLKEKYTSLETMRKVFKFKCRCKTCCLSRIPHDKLCCFSEMFWRDIDTSRDRRKVLTEVLTLAWERNPSSASFDFFADTFSVCEKAYLAAIGMFHRTRMWREVC